MIPELENLKGQSCGLREQAARTILWNVRAQGHTYVELREDGKRLIFFCILCHTPCYSDNVLLDHLRGHLHAERYATAKITLLVSNPWPFNDGALFFENRSESSVDGDHDLIVPGVLIMDEICELGLTFSGFGRIGARLCEKGGRLSYVRRIWCEWMGKEGTEEGDVAGVAEHGHAVVSFTYTRELGRKITMGDDDDDDDVMDGASRLRRSTRRRLRRQQCLDADRICDICQHKMFPGKDVAALLNLKTGKLACSSRNFNGVFHVFHVSCLTHWILLCEKEVLTNDRMDEPRKPRGSGRYRTRKKSKNCVGEPCTPTRTVFCPECQGTGASRTRHSIGLEKPTHPLSQIFKSKISLTDAKREWMTSPELLPNCSTGFSYSPPATLRSPQERERVMQVKMLRFYGASDHARNGLEDIVLIRAPIKSKHDDV